MTKEKPISKTLGKELAKMPPSVKRAIKNINLTIQGFLIKKKGLITTDEVEKFIGTKGLSEDLVINLLQMMESEGLIQIADRLIIADVDALKAIKEQEKTNLPENHNKLWCDQDYVKLAEYKLQHIPNAKIAILLKRTEGSIVETCLLLRKAYRLIPLIEKYPVIKEFAEKFESPKPTDYTNTD